MKLNKRVLALVVIITALITFLITKSILNLSAEERLIRERKNQEIVAYFNEVCIGSEVEWILPVTHKFNKPAKLYIIKDSSYTEQIKFVKKVLIDFNKLPSDGFKIILTTDSASANIYLYLCDYKMLKTVKRLQKADPNGFGFFNVNMENNYITDAYIFINTKKPLKQQKEAILEEIIQSVGFFRDSDFYPNSIFFQYKYLDYKKVDKPSNEDKKIIKLLYNPAMKVGLTKRQAAEINIKVLTDSLSY